MTPFSVVRSDMDGGDPQYAELGGALRHPDVIAALEAAREGAA